MRISGAAYAGNYQWLSRAIHAKHFSVGITLRHFLKFPNAGAHLLKVSVHIATANANTATAIANIATANVNTATADAHTATAIANTATADANIATAIANTATANTNIATADAHSATAGANTFKKVVHSANAKARNTKYRLHYGNTVGNNATAEDAILTTIDTICPEGVDLCGARCGIGFGLANYPIAQSGFAVDGVPWGKSPLNFLLSGIKFTDGG